MLRIAPLLVATAIGLSACGGDDASQEDEPATGAAPAQTTGGTAGTASSGDAVVVSMKAIQFMPNKVSANVGQTIRWVNDEAPVHNVVAEEGADFKSDDFGKDGTFEFVPTEAGTIKYTCTLHPGMDGEVTVEG